MNSLENELEQRIYNLKKIIKEKEKNLMKVPEGSVQIFSTDNRTQFYLNQNGKVRYMRVDEAPLVEKLCQKDYDQRILNAAKEELRELEKIKKNYSEKSYESVYDKLHTERKKRIHPIWLPDKEYVENWEKETYMGKGVRDGNPEYYTDKGERVRSKSEILIANALNKHRVPYRYEAPLELEPYGTIYPDFTCLNVKKRKEYRWEHMGMMDDVGYREYALDKILLYEKNGYFPGEELILTHETLKNPIHSKLIDQIILKYLK